MNICDVYAHLKYPVMYATAFTTLTAVTEGGKALLQEGGDAPLTTVGDTFVTNFPFFGLVNYFYARGVEQATRKGGRKAANALCIGVNAAFYGYAVLTQDSDPALQAAVTTAVGLALTNKQVSDLERTVEGEA